MALSLLWWQTFLLIWSTQQLAHEANMQVVVHPASMHTLNVVLREIPHDTKFCPIELQVPFIFASYVKVIILKWICGKNYLNKSIGNHCWKPLIQQNVGPVAGIDLWPKYYICDHSNIICLRLYYPKCQFFCNMVKCNLKEIRLLFLTERVIIYSLPHWYEQNWFLIINTIYSCGQKFVSPSQRFFKVPLHSTLV